ncbi:DMT family transporter [Rhodopseudomonas sp. P2A-2r]|uniref:DMT family transporter n=1 Tax=unclassified Rhodopseudomonas TaxID=2638247 RepID=UPI002234387B|nr:DMT family transporter [Rhodopseudomonas sp. P2A-2r]UZE48193.1 DMT family transporter [Rhodopseudomonas sp. P2A-2r]
MPPSISTERTPIGWLLNQPYLLLSLTSLFWAGNAIVGRAAAGHIPPFTLSFFRWGLAALILLPFGWRAMRQDWPVIRRQFGFMIFLSLISIGLFNSLQYWGLEYTTALNSLLLQSSGPLFVAIWSLLILRVRLTIAQACGIALSMIGVLVILLRGDLAALTAIELNKGDLLFLLAMAIFGLYAVLTLKRPAIQQLSFLTFTFACGALCLVPPFIWELFTRPPAEINAGNLLSLAYVAVFPSVLAYTFYNRGIALIGANRSAPFFHLIPVFGSAMAIFFLGETMHLFHIVGYALVLCGIVVAARKPKPAIAAASAGVD